jgi:Ser/Thr protein kinase RdoA (MazF antagonist)
MAVDPLDSVAREVLRAYRLAGARVQPLGNRGGFSGARLWRIRTDTADFCLRAWPGGDPTPERLRRIHQLVQAAHDAGLTFVPAVLATEVKTTWIEHQGRLWELTRWMPGRADFHAAPSPERLEAACIALARLHDAWAAYPSTGRCPAVQRRLEWFQEWSALVRAGSRPPFAAVAPSAVHRHAERAWRLLQYWADWVPRMLGPWAERVVPLQPCLCDVWHDHVLFDGDTVTGLVDFGAAKVDHVAVDLARLLGSMADDDQRLAAAGLHAYRRVRPLSLEAEALVGVLDRTGTIVALATWLKWLYRDRRPLDDPEQAARRLAELVKRVEEWQP